MLQFVKRWKYKIRHEKDDTHQKVAFVTSSTLLTTVILFSKIRSNWGQRKGRDLGSMGQSTWVPVYESHEIQEMLSAYKKCTNSRKTKLKQIIGLF